MSCASSPVVNSHASWSEPTLGFLVHDVARLLRKRLEQRARTAGIGLTRAQWQAQLWQLPYKTVLRCEIGHANLLAGGVDADEAELVRMVKTDIDRLYPHAAPMKVEWAKVYRERKHLYTKWVKGAFQKKPEDRDCGKGVYLAGDWTTKGTIGMEAAANSGIEAANHILGAEKLPLIAYVDVPLEG